MDSNQDLKVVRAALRKADIQACGEAIGRVQFAISAENLRPATLANYGSYLKIFAAWLELYCNGLSFQQVDIDTARRFTIFLKDQLHLSPNTINGYLAAVRKMFAVIQEKEVSKKILPDLAVDTRLPNVPSVEQVGKMLDACQSLRELLFIAMLISTGMRFCELHNLQFCDILRDRKVIYIRASKGRTDGYVPLTDRVLRILTDYCQEYNKSHPQKPLAADDYVFFTHDRLGPEKDYRLRRMFYQIKQRAELSDQPFNIHSLRHYFAMNLYIQSHDPILVKRSLRHRTYAATEKYVLLVVSLEAQMKYRNPGDMAFGKSQNHSTGANGGEAHE